MKKSVFCFKINGNDHSLKTSFFLLVFILLFSLNSPAQKGTFYENIFKNEFSELNKEYSNLKKEQPVSSIIEMRLHTPPQILPDWFMSPPSGGQDIIYAFGISDPWIEATKGRLQAKIRAVSVASLSRNLQTKGVVETYNNNQDNKFKQISQFLSFPILIQNCEPVDSFKTKYDELIYLFKFSSPKTIEADKNSVEYFISADNKDDKYSQLEKLRFISNFENVKTEYESIEINKIPLIKSIVNIDTTQILIAPYRYTINDSIKNDQGEPEICMLPSGLWQAYLRSLIHNLDFTAADIFSKMKSLSDYKEDEDSKGTLRNLIKTIYNVSFSFSISKIRIKNSTLELNLKSQVH
jgi:hypothetical protein